MTHVQYLPDCYSEDLWTHSLSRLFQEDDAKDLVDYWRTRKVEIESSHDGIPIPSHEQRQITDEELQERTALKLQAGKIECC